ncbi:MAG TPA: DUF6152 family protein [Vicinamibacterales bacterium]|jgi:Family of unknown function (DUF6152)|nr:DUF6152 family protein [Vicinamibacterales bacterium]
MRTLALVGLLVASAVMPASAHHSFAMFDRTKTMTLKGTVKEFQWINPHCWIVVLVPSAQGQKQWAIELESPSGLARKGFVPKSLTAGMEISVDIHPLKDGSPGGSGTGLSLRLADGTVKSL